ncbi:MAG: choice-of-anchor D domain-containing protein, partial [candidate division WOR-3 bacterium]
DNNTDPGDSVAVTLTVHNVGLVDAINVTGTIRTDDIYVNITDSLKNFGNILADSISISPENFDFNVLSECPANHIINFELITRDQNDSVWISSFVIPISTPDISLSSDTLNFDTVYLGYPDTIELKVNNLGRDTLVVSDILSDNTDYYVDNPDFEVFPLETHAVKVIFDPAIDVLSTGNLIINSNDIDEPAKTVFLQGEGLKAPDISVFPDSINDSLYTGDTSIDTLRIYNTGGSDLTFYVEFKELFPATKYQKVNFKITEYKNNKKTISEKNSESAAIFEEEFSKRIYESITPTSELQNILVMERGPGSFYYNMALENLGLPRTLVTSWDELHTELISGTQWELVIVNSYGNVPSEEILDLLDDYQSNGGLLIYTDWAIYEYPSHSLLTSLGISFVSDFTVPINFYAVDPGHILFNQPNDIDSLYWTDNQYNRDGQIVDILPGATQLAYPEGYPNSGAIVLNEKSNCLFNAFQSMNFNADDDSDGKTDIIELIENEITFLATQWLSINPISGTIPLDDSVLIEVIFDANNLYGGNYFADIIVASNDPDDTELKVPVHLHVTGIPDISVSKDTLDFGIVFNGHSATETLSISNSGTDLLTVNDISSDNPDFTADITNFTLEPKKTQAVTIILTPNSLGTISGKLTIYCDDPDEPTKEIILHGRCLDPPDISVSPESLNDSLVTGEISIHKLTVHNTGFSDLILSVSERIMDPFSPSVSLSKNQFNQKQKTEKRNNSLSKTSVDGKIATGNSSGNISRSYVLPTASGTANIAILGSESPGDEYLSNIAGYLINSGRFASVTTINAYEYTPTIAELQIYDVVGVFGWDYWYNAYAIGDLLADYIDRGGNVFLAFAAN